MNIDEIIKESIQKESGKIQIPVNLYRNIVSNNQNERHIHKTVTWKTPFLKYSFSMVLGMIIAFSLMFFFSPGLMNVTAQINNIGSRRVSEQEVLMLSSNIVDRSISSEDITKIYPKYIPSDMELNRRMVLDRGNRIELSFYSTLPNNFNRGISITILRDASTIDYKEYDEKIQLKNGQGYLQAIYTKDKKTIKLGRLFYKLNDNVVVIFNANYLIKDEITKVINSLEISNDNLPDNTNDSDIIEEVGSRIMDLTRAKNSTPSIDEVIKIIQDMNLRYEIVGNKQMYIGITVHEGIVSILTEGSTNKNMAASKVFFDTARNQNKK